MASQITREGAADDAVRKELIALLPELRGFARFLVRQRAEADDLVQEAVTRAVAALAQFQPGTNLRGWLFTILRNAHYEQLRRRRSERRALEESMPPETGGRPTQYEQAELADLERLLWQMPPLLREALVLVGARGLGYDEAALVCGVPVGTMKARVSRARAHLALALEGQTEPAPRAAALVRPGDRENVKHRTGNPRRKRAADIAHS
jgi:RNA polymerase sigma-70 factor (ECF subfamily)